jgi:NADH dehydrogenase
MSQRKRVVIIGGGFAGLTAARALRRVPVDVTLIDKRNFPLFQPLLYQVATGGLSPADIASPLRGILSRQENVRVIQATVQDIDAQNQLVRMENQTCPYDYLLVATGSKHHYFGNESWEETAPGLKTIEDALEIRGRVLSAFERAETETDRQRREALLTFVVVGGGPTGVELAGALGELAHYTLRRDFRSVDTAQTTILLVEGTDRLLPTYDPSLSEQAARALQRLGVTVRTKTLLKRLEPGRVMLATDTGREDLRAETILWGAGVQGSAFGRRLAETLHAETDRHGRLMVESDLSVPGFSTIFVIGDLAHYQQDGQPLPGVAPVAMQQGTYVARLIRERLRGKELPAFHYADRGSMAVIGRAAAVAQIGRTKFHGLFAWLIWLFIHLIHLVEFENRILVLLQWAWNYFTKNRSARLITYSNCKREREKQGTGSVPNPSENLAKRQVTVPVPLSRGP